jgi:hypothetical protein
MKAEEARKISEVSKVVVRVATELKNKAMALKFEKEHPEEVSRINSLILEVAEMGYEKKHSVMINEYLWEGCYAYLTFNGYVLKPVGGRLLEGVIIFNISWKEKDYTE